VQWLSQTIDRSDMSEALRNSTGSIGTISNIGSYDDEVDKLISGASEPKLISADEKIEDPAAFTMHTCFKPSLI
jgi:restriction system protein